ncbi:hypothetical protein [uncultured Methylobacterium sp.]|jgi:hypothetical protein|uniref:hypothetical protein n=1 Tax=uncultured Methylobacterium sp. TaxID=157278 RepID=UPI00261BE5A9|nr:hypothetical protein [uncultured Methylobacterium sp.]
MSLNVIHEIGRFYVVLESNMRPGGPGAFVVRYQGPVVDVDLCRFSGSLAREKAIARADELPSQEP